MYLNHIQTSSCPFAAQICWRTHEWKEGKCLFYFWRGPRNPVINTSHWQILILQLHRHLLLPKHASLHTLPANQETRCTVTEVQSFSETVHKMQSQISILRDKPTMYLNVLLLLNNWEKFKVSKIKKIKKDKKKRKRESITGYIRSATSRSKGCTYTPQHHRRSFFLIINKTTSQDQDIDSVCKMFLIRLLEKEYKVLVAQSLHHHDVWIV